MMIKLISHNQGVFIAIIMVVVLMLWTYGCESKVTSPITGEMVTRPQLELEVSLQVKRLELELDNLQEQAALQFLSLDRQDEIKRKLYEFAAITSTSKTFNPIGLITLVGTILGFGAGIDNRIKDKVIKNRPLTNTVLQTDIDRG